MRDGRHFYYCSLRHITEYVNSLEVLGAHFGYATETTEDHITQSIFLGHRLVAFYDSCRLTGKTWGYCSHELGRLYNLLVYGASAVCKKPSKAVLKAFRRSLLVDKQQGLPEGYSLGCTVFNVMCGSKGVVHRVTTSTVSKKVVPVVTWSDGQTSVMASWDYITLKKG